MVYRRTARVEARLAETRERIVAAALSIVAREGYSAAGVPAIAAAAGLSTGAIYRYFPSKAALFDEVFRRASQREIDICAAAARHPGTARERLARVVETFARRALRGRRLAWALLAEPVDPIIEAERLRYRVPYRDIFAGIVADGVASGEIESQDATTTASAIVGAIAEALVGPLARDPAPEAEGELIAAIVRFCVRALGEPAKGKS